MSICYRNIFKQNPAFQRAVNLSMDLGNMEAVNGYIPTKSSADVLAFYLDSALHPGGNRASLLIGPYGKGKSHAVLAAMSILSENDDAAEDAFEELASRLENIHPQAAKLVRQVRREKLRLLPIVINDRYPDIRQAFLASLKQALKEAGLSELMPDNYFSRALDTLERWRREYPRTYEACTAWFSAREMNMESLSAGLGRCDDRMLSQFMECHKAILSGTTFDPMLESDVPSLYASVCATLAEKSIYRGLFISFDEFGKYLEDVAAAEEKPRFKVLQDLAEMCTRSADIPMLLTCITHKAISEYARNAEKNYQDSFRTVEGRFAPLYFNTSFEGSFTLIAGALGRKAHRFEEFRKSHAQNFAYTAKECAALGCFDGYEHNPSEIVEACFPMHPITALCLMRLSERAAQNERTLFTFLADPAAPMTEFIQVNDGAYALADITMVYDYFHISIRENSYDPQSKSEMIYADSLLPLLDEDAKKLVQAVVVLKMAADASMPATDDVLLAALQWDRAKLLETAGRLVHAHLLYVRHSDGVYHLMRSASKSLRQEIEKEITTRIDLSTQLTEIHAPGFTLPRRYNDNYEMLRFFRNVYILPETFFAQQNSNFLVGDCFADGVVLYLLGNADIKAVRDQLERWGDDRILILVPTGPMTHEQEIRECRAIYSLLKKSDDPVMTEELGYYYDDMLNVVERVVDRMFGVGAMCVTRFGVNRLKRLSEETSRLCEHVYPDTPIICHEMMNRNRPSGQMLKARAKVLQAVLMRDDYMKAFTVKSAERAILKAVLGNLPDVRMQRVMGIIGAFLQNCGNGRQSLELLYHRLTGAPFGLRRGVLPILLAYRLRDVRENATLYDKNIEVTLSGETLNSIDERPGDFSLRVEARSAQMQVYLNVLRERYTPESPTPEIKKIYDVLCGTVRKCSRSARTNRTTLDENGVVQLSECVTSVRGALIRFDAGARATVLEALPKAVEVGCSETCAQAVINAVDSLTSYEEQLVQCMGKTIVSRLVGTKDVSVRGAMTVWMENQRAEALHLAHDRLTAELMKVMRREDDGTDALWVNRISIALTGLPVSDWGDGQIAKFTSLLDEALKGVEEAQIDAAAEDMSSDEPGVHIALGGRVLSHKFEDAPLKGNEKAAFNTLKYELSEFADSLTTEQKLRVLATLMLQVNE